MSFRTSNDLIIDEIGLTSAFTTDPIDLTNQYLFALQAVWENAGAGRSITIEVSLNGSDWFELSAPSITTAGAQGTEVVQINEFAYKFARVVVAAGASADLKVIFNGKGI